MHKCELPSAELLIRCPTTLVQYTFKLQQATTSTGDQGQMNFKGVSFPKPQGAFLTFPFCLDLRPASDPIPSPFFDLIKRKGWWPQP